VDERRKVEQDVGGRDEDEDDGQLAVPLVEAGGALDAARGLGRDATVAVMAGGDGGVGRVVGGRRGRSGRVDGEQRDVSVQSSAVASDASHTRHDERVEQRDCDDRNHA